MALILASKSAIRATLLRNAGLTFECCPAHFDENALKQQGLPPTDLAQRLAEEKALEISRLKPTFYVLGADQVLSFQGQRFDKPRSRLEAKTHLQQLSGQTHHLISGVSLALGGKILWSFTQSAALTMWHFDDAFLDHYLESVGDAVLETVGGYHLEGRGSQLFQAIEGDYFTILGLPLLPLLEKFRAQSLNFFS